MAARFIPEREFDPIPQSKFVVDDAQIVFYDMLSRADGFCDFTVFESLGNECNDPLLAFVRNAFSVAIPSKHNCLRYKSVASFTRLIPSSMPKRTKRRLKCALTVRRAILSWS